MRDVGLTQEMHLDASPPIGTHALSAAFAVGMAVKVAPTASASAAMIILKL
jgi:hypothetical protein